MKLPIPWMPLILTIVILAATVYEHETAHKLAYEYKGYYNNTMGFDLGEGRAYVQNFDDITEEDERDIYLANMMVDSIGYNVTAPLISICLILLLAMWIREQK